MMRNTRPLLVGRSRRVGSQKKPSAAETDLRRAWRSSEDPAAPKTRAVPGRGRQAEADERPAAVGALGGHLAAVGLGHLPDDGEPEPGAGLPARRGRAVEAVEDVRQVVLVDARPVVADGHLAVADADLDLAAGRAPLGRVVEQVADGALDRSGHAADDGLLEVGHERDAAAVAAHAVDRLAGHEVEADVLGLARRPRRGRGRRARRRARSSRRAARRRRPAGARAPPRGIASSRASTSMFVRRLVSGVRSSCEASATKRRWLRAESSSAASMVLKLPARRPSSSVPSSAMRRERSRVSVTSSVASVSRRTGASAVRATSSPRAAASPIPPSATRTRIVRSRSRLSSTSVSGRAIWTT